MEDDDDDDDDDDDGVAVAVFEWGEVSPQQFWFTAAAVVAAAAAWRDDELSLDIYNRWLLPPFAVAVTLIEHT